jgi:hypothetical protein
MNLPNSYIIYRFGSEFHWKWTRTKFLVDTSCRVTLPLFLFQSLWKGIWRSIGAICVNPLIENLNHIDIETSNRDGRKRKLSSTASTLGLNFFVGSIIWQDHKSFWHIDQNCLARVLACFLFWSLAESINRLLPMNQSNVNEKNANIVECYFLFCRCLVAFNKNSNKFLLWIRNE